MDAYGFFQPSFPTPADFEPQGMSWQKTSSDPPSPPDENEGQPAQDNQPAMSWQKTSPHDFGEPRPSGDTPAARQWQTPQGTGQEEEEEVRRDRLRAIAGDRQQEETAPPHRDDPAPARREPTRSRDDLPADLERPPMPAFIGEWKVLKMLGEGGMSTVYKVQHRVLNRIAAAKVLLPQLVSRTTNVKRFEQEARAMANLTHPNIVKVHDYGVSRDGLAYLIEDLVEGESLDDMVVMRGKFPPQRAISAFQQICSALEHAHSMGILHRDLKPSNIMIVREQSGKEIVKVVDFGLAKLLDGEAEKITRSSDVVGTPFYMSPEQIVGDELDARSDVYAMGCLMYEVLAGVPPFFDEHLIAVLQKHLSDTPQALVDPKARDSLLKRLNTIIFKCLAKGKNQRYQSMSELRADLLLATEKSSKFWNQREKSVQKIHRKPKKINRLRIAVYAMSMVLLIVGIGWFGTQFAGKVTIRPEDDFMQQSMWITPPETPKEASDFEFKRSQVERAITLARNTTGVTPAQLGDCDMKLADFFKHNGHWSDAAYWYARAGKQYEQAVGPDSREVARATKNIGICQFYLGQSDYAENSLQESVSLMDKYLRPPDQPRDSMFRGLDADQILEQLQLLEIIHSRKGDLNKAAEDCREILLVYGSMPGHGQDRLRWQSEAADIFRRRNDRAKKDPLNAYGEYKHVLEQWLKVDPDSADAARALFGFGLVCMEQKNFTEADTALRQARETAIKALPNGDPLVPAISRVYANCLWQNGKWLDFILTTFSL